MTRLARTLGRALAFAAVCTVIYVVACVLATPVIAVPFFALGPADFARALAAVAAVAFLVACVVVHVERRPA
jgi:hypothetical protein